jgi:CMP-N,N'-diacetyllegionaminic acid synthase
MRKILVVIPARGGSKGIKNKNIIMVGGKPLIYYSISPALRLKKVGLVSEVIVSTDSLKIAEISKKLGVTVPFLRPGNISGDKSKSIDLILHALDFFKQKGNSFDDVLLLQPTSPLRKYEDIKKAINFYIENKNLSMISAYREKGVIESIIYTKEKNVAVPVLQNHNKGVRRQEAREIFVRNGAIYMSPVDFLRKNKRIVSNKPVLFEMTKEKSLNIDSIEDLKKMRKILCK